MADTDSSIDELRSSIDAWSPVLRAAPRTAQPKEPLVNAWKFYTNDTDAKAIAASEVSPTLVLEAISLGFKPEDEDPKTVDVLQARSVDLLPDPIDRSTARRLCEAMIRFDRPVHCGLIKPALRLETQCSLSLADAVFLLKRLRAEEDVIQVLRARPHATAVDINEILWSGSTTADWTHHEVDASTRRHLQRNQITPDRYGAWAELGLRQPERIVHADQTWTPDQAADWMEELKLPHGDTIEWFIHVQDMRIARAWAAMNYSATQARQLRDRSVSPTEANEWSALDVHDPDDILDHRSVWTPPQLAQWSGWAPHEALAWSRVFESNEEASRWHDAGLPLELTEHLAAHAWDPAQINEHEPETLEAILRFAHELEPFEKAQERCALWKDPALRGNWASSLDGTIDPDDLDNWYRSGLSLESVGFLAEAGQTPADGALFNELAITSIEDQQQVLHLFESPATLRNWLDAGFSQQAAGDWRAANFSLDAAQDWHEVGATTEQAKQLTHSGATASVWQGYTDLGIDFDTANAMAQSGLDPVTFLVWKNELSDLGELDVLAWFGVTGNLHDVKAWRAQGLTPLQASAASTSHEW